MDNVDERVAQILIEHNPARDSVELHITSKDDEEYSVIRLAPPDARRLAALILLQAGRVDPRRAAARLVTSQAVRHS